MDMFLKIGDIKGESTDDRHRDEIVVLSWSWGVTQTASTPTGSGAGAGRASFSDFSFTHFVDRASPNLMKACATGEHIRDAILTVRKAGAGQQELLIVRMSDVIVTSVLPSGNHAEDRGVEQAGVRCARFDLEYRPQNPDGSVAQGVHFKFDIAANHEIVP